MSSSTLSHSRAEMGTESGILYSRSEGETVSLSSSAQQKVLIIPSSSIEMASGARKERVSFVDNAGQLKPRTDLVQDVEAGDVYTATCSHIRQPLAVESVDSLHTLNNVDELVECRVAPERDIGIADLVFREHGLRRPDLLVSLSNGFWHSATRLALISSGSMWVSGTVFEMAIPPRSFFLTVRCGGCLLSRIPKPSSSCSMICARHVESQRPRAGPKGSKRAHGLVTQGLENVEHNEDEVARPCDCGRASISTAGKAFPTTRGLTSDDLPSTSLSVLGSLDNSWQVEDLNRGAVHVHRARNPVSTPSDEPTRPQPLEVQTRARTW